MYYTHTLLNEYFYIFNRFGLDVEHFHVEGLLRTREYTGRLPFRECTYRTMRTLPHSNVIAASANELSKVPTSG